MKTLRPATGLAESVKRLTAEREVASSNSGAGSILKALPKLRPGGTAFAL